MHKRTPKPGLKSIPSVVQLPGGIRLTGIPFRITSYDAEGRPLTFEVMPPDVPMPPPEEGGLVLFADEVWLRMSRVGKAAGEVAAPHDCNDPSHQNCGSTP